MMMNKSLIKVFRFYDMRCFVMLIIAVCILFLFKPLIRGFTIQRQLFWSRSQQVGHPSTIILLLVCRLFLATAEFQ